MNGDADLDYEQALLDLESAELDMTGVEVEKVYDGVYRFTVPDLRRCRLIGLEVIRGLPNNEVHLRAALRWFVEPGILESFRLDGYQLSYYEKEENGVYSVQIQEKNYGNVKEQTQRFDTAIQRVLDLQQQVHAD